MESSLLKLGHGELFAGQTGKSVLFGEIAVALGGIEQSLCDASAAVELDGELVFLEIFRIELAYLPLVGIIIIC